MGEQEPTMRTMELSAVSDQLAGLVAAVYRKEMRIEIEQDGIPVAALVAPGDLVRLIQTAQSWEEGTRALERIGEAFADVPTAEMEAEIARIIAKNRRRRARMEAERQPA